MENYRGSRNQSFPRPANAEGFKACVKNIPVDMTRESLQALFSGCGNVVSGKVLPPRDGRPTTIGFIGFASEDELATAVETMHGATLEGARLTVAKAIERNRGTLQQDNQYQRNQDTGYHNEQTFSNRDTMGVSHAMPLQGYVSHQTEQTLFSVNGPGRGGGPSNSYSRLPATALANEPSFSNHQEVGVKRESAIFNPAGPGRGGGMVMPHQPPASPGRGSMLMNSIARNLGEKSDLSPYSRVQSYTSNDDSGHQSNIYNGELPRWTPSTEQRQQDMGLTGRLPYSATSSPPHNYMAPEKTDYSHNGFDKCCYKCGDESHFARVCPVAAAAEDSSGNKGSPNRVGPVTYVPPELPANMDELFQDMPHSGLNFDKYDTIPVHVTGKTPPPPISSFQQAGLLEQCSINIKRALFTKPTPIQKYAIPIALQGRDLMACAQTGSGKTVAFLLPVLTQMIKQGHLSGGYLSGDNYAPAALCMAPTRELALQIYKEVRKFSDGTVVKAAVCYGGVSVQYQLSKLAEGCHFLIATPGRLEDFISRGWVSLSNVRYLILDEADRMLDMGFEPAIRKLVEACGMPDKLNRQTLMFSATFPDQIQKLAADFLKENYLFVAVGRVGGSNLDICQSVIPASADEKQAKLFEILHNSGTDRTLVFVELKRVADFLACLLSGNNFPTTSISGDRTQQEREAALQDFRSGRAPVLVATSVAARGLDIPDVKHVINFDLPQDIEEYVHRIGRTGRIGNKGRATSFFQHGKDERLARSLVKVLSEAFQEVPEWLEQVAEEAIGSSYGPAGGKFASRDRREREHSRPSAPTGTASVTRAMQQLSVQSQQNGVLPQFKLSAAHCEEEGEDWD